MNILGLLFILLSHYLLGKGVLNFFKLNIKHVYSLCLSFIIGVAAISFVPLLLQLINVSITGSSIFICIVVLIAIIWLPNYKKISKPVFIKPKYPAVYEFPFLIVCILLTLIGVWRNFYYPPLPRDLLTGPELIAEYAVREKTLINSVFSIDLSTSNNYFKSPFITGLQIVYKIFVCPFGQMWLSVLVIPFIVIIYTLLKEKLHPIIASFLLMLFVTIPEIYAYTYLVLYDYSNMVFFFVGVYFLIQYFENKKMSEFALSVFLLGLATYIRTETLVLLAMIFPLVLFYTVKQKVSIQQKITLCVTYFIVPFLFYFLCIKVFIALFIPIPFNVTEQLNDNLFNIWVLFDRLKSINTELLFSDMGISVYGYFIYFFILIVLMDLVVRRGLSKEAFASIYCIAVVYFGMAIIGYLIPYADILNTTKRGFFKFLPLMILYMRNSGSLNWLSEKIGKWEILPK